MLSGDHSEALVLAAATDRAWKLLFDLQKGQATLIANAMVKARIGG